MSDRDRQNSYDRNQQQGGYRSEGYEGSRQANQWQSDDHRQHGDDWQDAGQRGSGNSGNYRFSGEGNRQEYGRGQYGRDDQRGQNRNTYGGSYGSQLNDDDLRSDQRDASRNYERARGSYGQHQDRGRSDWQQGGSQQNRSGQRGSYGGYAGRDFDASGGNDFGNFTSEDYGGRDFYNRGGGVTGGARSSESYRPSYGLSSWLNSDDDNRSSRGNQDRGREDYGSWRQYGESRGFVQRASDEVASWFGDEDASRRRDQDRRDNERSQGSSNSSYASGYQNQSQTHRGRGPSNYTRSDERIREDANDHLTHDHHVDASHIDVSVKDGELTLNGTVDSRDAKRRAEDAVEHISGVKHVQNNLRVQDRSFGSSGSGGASYGSASGLPGQSSGSGLSGSGSASTGSSTSGLGSSTSGLGSSTGGSSTTGTTGSSTGTTGSGIAGSSTPASGTSGSGTTGSSTTSGIGSAAPAGVSGGSTTKTS